jgi:hypothetical protein
MAQDPPACAPLTLGHPMGIRWLSARFSRSKPADAPVTETLATLSLSLPIFSPPMEALEEAEPRRPARRRPVIGDGGTPTTALLCLLSPRPRLCLSRSWRLEGEQGAPDRSSTGDGVQAIAAAQWGFSPPSPPIPFSTRPCSFTPATQGRRAEGRWALCLCPQRGPFPFGRGGGVCPSTALSFFLDAP